MSHNHKNQALIQPVALTIAGSDSGAGAGVQADLKTFAALGIYGLSAITAITAQNTLGVRAVQEIQPSIVAAQIDAVMEDMGAQAAKTGMLSSSAIIEIVAERAKYWRLRLVVDPVMVAKGGEHLLRSDAVTMLRDRLLPLAEVVTPNIPEAEVLTGRSVRTLREMADAARAIYDLGARYVVVKCGHLTSEPVDVLFDGSWSTELHAERIATRHTHGTGCTFAAAITALLARQIPVEQAVTATKRYVTGAIQHAQGIGHGHGPADHFWLLREHLQSDDLAILFEGK